jgi:hypothetical protein
LKAPLLLETAVCERPPCELPRERRARDVTLDLVLRDGSLGLLLDLQESLPPGVFGCDLAEDVVRAEAQQPS